MTTSSNITSLAALDSASFSRRQQADIALLRRYSAEMCLWLFCRNARCHRTRNCRGNANGCIDRYAPLVPEDVREAARLMLHGFDRSGVLGDAPFEIDEEEAAEVLGDWAARVAHASAEN